MNAPKQYVQFAGGVLHCSDGTRTHLTPDGRVPQSEHPEGAVRLVAAQPAAMDVAKQAVEADEAQKAAEQALEDERAKANALAEEEAAKKAAEEEAAKKAAEEEAANELAKAKTKSAKGINEGTDKV